MRDQDLENQAAHLAIMIQTARMAMCYLAAPEISKEEVLGMIKDALREIGAVA